MIRPLAKTVIGCLLMTSGAWASESTSRHSGALADFETQRGNAIAGLSGDRTERWSQGYVVDPAVPPNNQPAMTGPQLREFKRALVEAQDSFNEYWQKRNSSLPTPEKNMTLEQRWASLSSATRSILERYGVNWANVETASLAPYFTYKAAGEPKQLYVVDQDFFREASVTQYKNKNVTRYYTYYYSYPVWVNGGGCGCRAYIAYWATASYQIPYTETVQVPAAYSVAVEAITPTKQDRDQTTNISVPVNYTDYEPVYTNGGNCGCRRSLAYYRQVTRTRYEPREVTETVLKDQVPKNDDKGRTHLFAPAGTEPDADSNITFTTDADGNIQFQNASTAMENFSGHAAEPLNNPAHPRPQ